MHNPAKKAAEVLAAVLTLGFFALPIAFLISVSFKTPDDVLLGRFLPTAPTFENWPTAFEVTNLTQFIFNSVIASIAAGLLTIAIALPATYGMVRLKVGKAWLPDFTLSSYVAPPIVAVLPLFYLLKSIGLLNSLFGLILIYGFMNLPVAFWLLAPFLRQVPVAIEEAAALDGAGPFVTLVRVVAPMVAPGIAATLLISIILSYNEFLLASALAQTDAARTLTVGVSLFQGERLQNAGQMAVASLAGIIPIYIVALFGQRWLVKGLTHGGVK
jgi:multiple sugar transport system permease protein